MTTLPPDRSYPVEISPPDLTPYRNQGSGPEYVISYDSGAEGPHVMLMALVHGNEICGAIALDRLLKQSIRPNRGRLSFAFANIAAFEEFDPRYPEATRYIDEDFNRPCRPKDEVRARVAAHYCPRGYQACQATTAD